MILWTDNGYRSSMSLIDSADMPPKHGKSKLNQQSSKIEKEPNERQKNILDLLTSSQKELSAQQIHYELQNKGVACGLATVYRYLKQLQILGLVRCRMLLTGEAFYSPINRDQHHVYCIQCGYSETLNICPFDSMGLGKSAYEMKGFRPLFHTFDIHGLCRKCEAI